MNNAISNGGFITHHAKICIFFKFQNKNHFFLKANQENPSTLLGIDYQLQFSDA